jgi:hypothetical protein
LTILTSWIFAYNERFPEERWAEYRVGRSGVQD